MERLSLLFAAVLGSAAQAQNLVPNGSFEEYTICPDYFGQAAFCTGWINLYTQSADYFNACHTNNVVGVPLNQFGYQWPADGVAYMGMGTYAFGQPEYREMAGIQLSQPLQVGVPVCLSFRTAVGGFGTSVGNSAGYTCKGIGMKFFTEFPTEQYIYDYPNSAAIHLNEIPTDTAIWYLVEGTYVADSAYQFVVVGNFFADSLNQPTIQDQIGINATDVAYAFVDDLRVSFALTYCAGHIGFDSAEMRRVVVYPNPVASQLHLVLPTGVGSVTLSIHDIAGRKLGKHQGGSPSHEQRLDVSYLPEGVYVLHVTDGANSFAPVRFVHVTP